MFITRESFDKIAEIYYSNKEMFLEIYNLIRERGDLSAIGISCYVCDQLGHMSLECPEYWRIEGNVKRHLRRLKSINNKLVEKKVSEEEDKFSKLHRQLTSKTIKAQDVQDDEIREIIKHNLAHGGTEDIIQLIRKNQQVAEDDDEIGMHDHVFDSSSEESKKKPRAEDSLSAIFEDEEDSEKQSLSKKDTMQKLKAVNFKKIATFNNPNNRRESKKRRESVNRKNFPGIEVTKMHTLHQDTMKGSKKSKRSLKK